MLFRTLGVSAEAVVKAAFSSSGFGKWAPNAPSTIKAKGGNRPLIGKSVQLSRSVSSEAVKEDR